MIICPRCSKENQDHYKFCLGCGSELPRDAAQQPKTFTAPTPPAGFSSQNATGNGSANAGAPAAASAASAGATSGGGVAVAGGGGLAAVSSGAAAPAAAPTTGQVTCPACGQVNPANFKFCGSCGQNLDGAKAEAGAAPPAAPAPAASTGTEGRAVLVLIRPDGTEGEAFPIPKGAETPVGRDAGGAFGSDSYLSPRHASFRFTPKGLQVKDEGSLNGVYYRIEPEVAHELSEGSIFRIGQEIVRFESLPISRNKKGVEVMGSPNPGYLGRLRLVIGRETYGNSFCIPPDGLHMGRERGDIVFPDDGYVSGLHCRVHGEPGKVQLTDVGSSNGTFMRVRGEVSLKSGTMLLMGQQLFRADY